MENEIHHKFMHRAIALARKAAQMGEVPVGAVVVHQGQIIGEGHNLRESEQNPLAHAEILALKKASEHLGAWRLQGCTLYVTLEPCLMCSGASLNARVDQVVYGAKDPKAGAVSSLYQTLEDTRLNHRCNVIEGVLHTECAALLSEFFSKLRSKKKNN